MSQDPQIQAELSQGVVSLSFAEDIYPKDVVFGAAYVLLDRAFVHVDRNDGRLIVVVRPKPGVTLDAQSIAGEFENEALAQAWRREILNENRALIESVTMRAFAGAAGPPGLDDLLDASMGEMGDAFDDPLGIAMSWEEKYGKKSEEQVDKSAEQASQDSGAASPPGEPKP